jgi:thiamine-phosphate pyrophosphorylase
MSALFRKRGFIYLLTDRGIAGLRHSEIARRALSAGIRIIQLREKEMSRRDLFREAVKIREITERAGALFIVNDYVDLALACRADGVHLGQDDLPLAEARRVTGEKMIIGVSTHSLAQAVKAEEGGADYIGFGPMFGTRTKDAGRPRGLRALQRVRRSVKIPIVAIGGINPGNVRDVIMNGADACAVVSAVLRGDIRENAASLLSAANL